MISNGMSKAMEDLLAFRDAVRAKLASSVLALFLRAVLILLIKLLLLLRIFIRLLR